MNHSLLGLTIFLGLSSILVGQTASDPELTNYKSGIDVTWNGTKGVAYLEEYFYHDKLITDRKVVYIKSGTLISMGHNSRDVSFAGDGTYQKATGVGQIMYKVDRDMQWGLCWGDGSGTTTTTNFDGTHRLLPLLNNAFYAGPFSFDTLRYDEATPVVGTVGPRSNVSQSDIANYYWRGVSDKFGDEWHTITVADFDPFITNPEGKASDGRIHLFVVNPKTPALTFRASSGGQFYTTPAKIPFIPKIHDQITYISANGGTVSFSIQDISGNDVFFRVNGGSWSAGARIHTLSDRDLNDGNNTLEYYYAGRQANAKTRIIIKNPAYPSANENHGHLLWGNAAEFSKIKSRLQVDPYATNYSRYRSNTFENPLDLADQTLGRGLRTTLDALAINSAFAAAIEGYTATPSGKLKSFATYSKQILLESRRCLDPVGFELGHSGTAIPARELFYRGYYDVKHVLSLVFAYDILISGFRSNQVQGGITAIEDYLIRDHLASFAFEQMGSMGCWTGKSYPNTGMWGTARHIGGLAVALAMPSYSTQYYGTSGVDGNATVYPWTPYPDYPLTWKKAFIDNDAPLRGYPNLHFRFGVEEYNFSSDAAFLDRVPYFGAGLMGFPFSVAANLVRMHLPGVSFPNLEKAFVLCAENKLIGLKDPSEGTRGFSQILVFNSRFPKAYETGMTRMKSLSSTDPENESRALYGSGIYGLVWYEGPRPPTSVYIRASVE